MKEPGNYQGVLETIEPRVSFKGTKYWQLKWRLDDGDVLFSQEFVDPELMIGDRRVLKVEWVAWMGWMKTKPTPGWSSPLV
jgi:hypothetical protein